MQTYKFSPFKRNTPPKKQVTGHVHYRNEQKEFPSLIKKTVIPSKFSYRRPVLHLKTNSNEYLLFLCPCKSNHSSKPRSNLKCIIHFTTAQLFCKGTERIVCKCLPFLNSSYVYCEVSFSYKLHLTQGNYTSFANPKQIQTN